MKINYDKRIFGLDIMRAVAILLVVFSHALWILPRTKNLLTDLLSLAGVIGVEIFFVLSGFLIGRIIFKLFVNDNFSFKDVKYFWVRRWFRTLPNYYLILLINIALTTYLSTILPENIESYFLFLQNFTTEMPSFFGESWSLPIEEFAYIIGPLLLYVVLFFKLGISRSKLFGLIALLIIVFFMITKVFYNQGDDIKTMIFWNVNLKAITIYRIDAIYYGVLAAWLALVNPLQWKSYKWVSFFIGVFIFLSLNFIIPTQRIFIETHPFFWNVLYLPINSIAIAFCLPLLSSISSAPKLILVPITYISVISYSMYLLHYSVVLQLLKHFFPTEGITGLHLYGYILMYFAITMILSYVLYRFFEKPMMDLRDKPFVLQKFNKS